MPLDKAPSQVRELPLVFLPERLELPTASGTDVALSARKLRLRGQLRSGLGPWGAIVSAAAATTIAARAAMAPAATVADALKKQGHWKDDYEKKLGAAPQGRRNDAFHAFARGMTEGARR